MPTDCTTTRVGHGARRPMIAALGATIGPLGLFALLTLLIVSSAALAHAVCGDGALEPSEMCDDGNVADGDCCTATCQRPGGCFPTTSSGLRYRDFSDDTRDKILWRYGRGETTFEDWGDPTAETSYSFCIWDDDELKLDSQVHFGGLCQPQRPCWQILGREDVAQGYKYFNKPGNDSGVQRVVVASRKPPDKAYMSVTSRGTEIDPVGPVGFDQYFNQNVAVKVQLLRNDAPICWEAAYTTNRKNTAKRFNADIRPND